MKKVKITVAVILAAITIFFVGCTAKKDKVPVIGISQYGEHASLDNCREGFLLGLKEAGLTEGEDYTIDYQNASFDNATATQIANNFSSKNVAIMCAIATPSATACYAAAEDKNIPVVFNAITDPGEAGLTTGNITGVSDKLPVDPQLELIRKLQPDAKTIGIIYTTSEPNSVSAIAEYKEKAGNYGFTIEAIGVADQASVTQAADTLITKKGDGSTNLIGSEIEQVKKGCVASAGIDYVELGKMAGKLAAQILKGEAKASDLPYETVTEYSTYINSDAASAMGITVPSDVAAKAIECK